MTQLSHQISAVAVLLVVWISSAPDMRGAALSDAERFGVELVSKGVRASRFGDSAQQGVKAPFFVFGSGQGVRASVFKGRGQWNGWALCHAEAGDGSQA